MIEEVINSDVTISFQSKLYSSAAMLHIQQTKQQMILMIFFFAQQ